MIRALYTAATGMQAQETNIDVISNNLANVNTTAYKRGIPSFQDLFYQTVVEPGAATSATTRNPTGLQIGLGVKAVSVEKVFGQGDMNSTNNPLDVAVEGDGFFQVQMPDGSTSYTRSGNFRLNDQGQIVNPDGFQIDPTVTVPQDAQQIIIAKNGEVSAKIPGSASPQVLGTFTAVRFPNNSGLKAIGQNL